MRRLILFIALALTLIAIPASASVLKIATPAPEGSSWMKGMRAGAKEIKERTAGRVTVKLYGGGVMGNNKSVLRKIRVGQLQGGAFITGGLSDVCPDVKLYSLPFLFNNMDEVRVVREQMDPVLIKNLYDKGFVSFGFAGNGFAELMSEKPVRTMADLKGRKIWAPADDAVNYAVLESLGLSPVPLPVVDIMTGLQTGLLDIVTSTSTAALAFQWYTKVKYVSDVPLVYVSGTLVVSRRAFEKLSPEDQAVVREVMGRVYEGFDSKSVEDEAQGREVLKKQGIEFIDVNPDAVKVWRDSALATEARLAKEGKYSEELFNRINIILKEHRAGGSAQ